MSDVVSAPGGENLEQLSDQLASVVAPPVPPMPGVNLVGYAEFFLPIFLLLGLATRFSALGLLIIVAMIQFYVLPEALRSPHTSWAAILLVLLSPGPGQISVDQVIRYLSRW